MNGRGLLARVKKLESAANPDHSEAWAKHCVELNHAAPLLVKLGLPDIAARMEKNAAAAMPHGWQPDTRTHDDRAAEIRRKLEMD